MKMGDKGKKSNRYGLHDKGSSKARDSRQVGGLECEIQREFAGIWVDDFVVEAD